MNKFLLLVLIAGCAQQKPPVPTRDFDREAHALLQGLGPGTGCRNDRDCAEGQVQAACTLGTCFGLLTTDERPTRALLTDRLAHADVRVLRAAVPMLLGVLGADTTTTGQKLGSIEALAEVGRQAPNDEITLTLRLFSANHDEGLASAARLALGRMGDQTVQAALLQDLTLGTELLRAEAARALKPLAAAPEVRAGLVASLRDPSPIVQMAALIALDGQTRNAEVAAGLKALAVATPSLRYEAERAQLEGQRK